MELDAAALYELLPVVYRTRDAEIASLMNLPEGPLQALVRVLAGPIEALEDNLDQLYADEFIETCADLGRCHTSAI